jgi:hypothetical protein
MPGEREFFSKPVTANQQGPPVWTYSARSSGNIRSLGEIERGGANILEAADISAKLILNFGTQPTVSCRQRYLDRPTIYPPARFCCRKLIWSLVSPSRAVPREAIIERRGKMEDPPLISGLRYTETANTDGIHDDQTRDGISPPC